MLKTLIFISNKNTSYKIQMRMLISNCCQVSTFTKESLWIFLGNIEVTGKLKSAVTYKCLRIRAMERL